MKPADDPFVDYKALVRRGYDQCAHEYHQARQDQGQPELSLLLERLNASERVLDIGCGSGVPVARTLASQFRVTGVDISYQMIARARANLPEVDLIQGDIMDIQFPTAHFGAVVSYYAIFHLPREEHPDLFKRIHTWLKLGGFFLGTLANSNEDAYTEDDFFGTTMYWSNFGLDEYKQILQDLGFRLIDDMVLGHGYSPDQDRPTEHHPLIFAQKI